MIENTSNRDAAGRFTRGNRAAIKSGVYSFLSRGRLPLQLRGIRKLKREMEELQAELEAGISNITTRQRLLIAQIIRCKTYAGIWDAFITKMGCFNPDAAKKGVLDYMPGMKVYQGFLNQERHALKALSITQKDGEKPVMSVLDILKEEGENEKDRDSQAA